MYKSAETNINGYHVEFELSDDDGHPVSQCEVTLKFVNQRLEYHSSLAVIEHEGTIECDDGESVRPVADHTVAKIAAWAYEQGY